MGRRNKGRRKATSSFPETPRKSADFQHAAFGSPPGVELTGFAPSRNKDNENENDENRHWAQNTVLQGQAATATATAITTPPLLTRASTEDDSSEDVDVHVSTSYPIPAVVNRGRSSPAREKLPSLVDAATPYKTFTSAAATPPRTSRTLGKGIYSSPSPNRLPRQPPTPQDLSYVPSSSSDQPQSTTSISTSSSSPAQHSRNSGSLPPLRPSTTSSTTNQPPAIQLADTFEGSVGSYHPFGRGRFSDAGFTLDNTPLPPNKSSSSTSIRNNVYADIDSASDSDAGSVKELFTDQVDTLNRLLMSPDRGLGPLYTSHGNSSKDSSGVEDDYLNEEERDIEAARRALQQELNQVDFSIFEESSSPEPSKEDDDDDDDDEGTETQRGDSIFVQRTTQLPPPSKISRMDTTQHRQLVSVDDRPFDENTPRGLGKELPQTSFHAYPSTLHDTPPVENTPLSESQQQQDDISYVYNKPLDEKKYTKSFVELFQREKRTQSEIYQPPSPLGAEELIRPKSFVEPKQLQQQQQQQKDITFHHPLEAFVDTKRQHQGTSYDPNSPPLYTTQVPALRHEVPPEETSISSSLYNTFGFHPIRSQPGGDSLGGRSSKPASVAAALGEEDGVSVTSSLATEDSIFQSLANFSEMYGHHVPSPDRPALDTELYLHHGASSLTRSNLSSPNKSSSPISSNASPARLMSMIRLLESETPQTPPEVKRDNSIEEKAVNMQRVADEFTYPQPMFPDDENSMEDSKLLHYQLKRSDQQQASKHNKAQKQASKYNRYLRIEKTPEIKDSRIRDGNWLLRTVGTFDSTGGGGLPSPIVYADDDDDDEFEISFEATRPPPPKILFEESDAPFDERAENSYEFDQFDLSQMPKSYSSDTHPTNLHQSYSSDTKQTTESMSTSQRRKLQILCIAWMACVGLLLVLLGLAFGVAEIRNSDPNSGTGVNKTTEEPSQFPTVSLVPTISLFPTSVPTETAVPTKTVEPSATPTRSPSAFPTGITPGSVSFESVYNIIVANGRFDSIPSSQYSPDLISSMDMLVTEVMANMPEDRKRRLVTTVILPTEIAGIEQIDCPNPSRKDRCETVTAKVSLEDADDLWHTFQTTLEVAIRIGRLQYHLDEVNPQSSAEILDYTNGLPSPSNPPVQSPSPAPTSHVGSYSPSSAPTKHDGSYSPTIIGRFPTKSPTFLSTALPTNFPTTEPTSIPTSFSLFDFLVEQSFDGGTALQDPTTPQHRAYMWLSGNEDLASYSLQTIIQRYSLGTFYYSTDGDNWFFNDDWLSDTNECDWYNKAGNRKSCNLKGELKHLELDYNNLDGPLPPELGMLSNSLERVVLRGGPTSFTTGTLPSELGYLTMMKVFYLRGNVMSGQIPTELGNWRELEQLDLSRNRLSGPLPSEVGNLGELTLLDVSVNDLTGTLPTEIGNLVKTMKLIVENNMLSGPLPSELGLLRRVQDIMGGMNMFTSIPSELGRLTFCDTLSFYDNDIRGEIPSYLGSLRRLSKFILSLR